MSHDPRHPHRQDTFDLRDQMITDAAAAHHQHPHTQISYHQHQVQAQDDEEHSILEDDSQDEQDDDQDEFMDEDDSSSLSIPNETIDFDLVYSLHTFVATVEGQANVVKGDSLFLMDDSNSYWWLVRVLKTQEVGYIPAENIETPYERLARLNKHRNVDLATATPDEHKHDPRVIRDMQNRVNFDPSSRSASQGDRRVLFRRASVFYYPPAVWNEEEQEGWEAEDYEPHDTGMEHPLNDEDEFEEDEDEGWDDFGAAGPPQSTAAQSFAAQQQAAIGQSVTRPLALQQQQMQQQIQQQRLQYQDQQYQQQQQARGQQPSQYLQQPSQYSSDPSPQVQGSIQSLRPQNSNSSLRQQGSNPSLRGQGSREGLSPVDARSLNSSGSTSPAGGGASSPLEARGKILDPEALDSAETRKISATPSVAREQQYKDAPISQQSANSGSGPLLPSAILAQQENDRKRGRDREELDEEARKRRQKEGGDRPSSQNSNRGEGGKGKLQKVLSKESSKEKTEKMEREKEKERDGGKKKSLMGALFGRRSAKDDKSVGSSTKIGEEYYGRGSSLSASDEGAASGSMKGGYSTERVVGQHGGSLESSMSGHGLRVQQMDMKQQEAYQRWLESNRGQAPQPSYGLQSAPFVNASSSTSSSRVPTSAMKPGSGGQQGVTQFGERTWLTPGSGNGNSSLGMSGPGSGSGHQRPGSLILGPALGLEGGAIVPELSVMRVFAGSNLSTEATFKTVLINSSTTAADLVKQAMQRFRVAAGEDSADYFLTVKTAVEGSFTTLQPHEKPLQVFEEMVEVDAKNETLPTVKRSSISSISSLSSNLSMHSAIRRLPMNDFTDDSTVKFYLNRYDTEDQSHDRVTSGTEELPGPEGGKHESLMSMGSTTDEDPLGEGNSTNSNLAGSAPERLTSSSARFNLQVLIYPDDLPDGMVFDPHTEAIVPKSSLKDRTPLSSTPSSGIPQGFRRKVFVFPKNTTVAEVIELSLERFGIPEGVVDGGDEVEDKGSKRRSASRVRYGLSCLSDGQEKELLPSSKVLEAFSRPPSFRMIDQRRSGDGRRRSADVTLLLGSVEDIGPDDPAFILRRAVAYRMNNTPRSRLSAAPLDELARAHLQAQRESITASEASTNRDDEPGSTPTPTSARSTAGATPVRPPEKLSRQEIIAAQRAASRDKQRAILSAQSNSEQGVDIILPDKATIRSSRLGTPNDGIRYSYIEPDGETYDISEIMEEEWHAQKEGNSTHPNEDVTRSIGQSGEKGDLLESALGRQGVSEPAQHNLGDNINRVLNRVKNDPTLVGSSGGRVSSVYSDKDLVLSPPSRPERAPDRAPSRSSTPSGMQGTLKTGKLNLAASDHRKNTSVHSFEGSEPSVYESTSSTPNRQDTYAGNLYKARLRETVDSPNRSVQDEGTEEDHYLPPASARKRPLVVHKDHDFGFSRMMAVVEMSAVMREPAPWQKTRAASQAAEPRRLRRQQSMLTSDTIVDDVLFGPKLDLEELHPKVREIYEPVAKRLSALDKEIDDLLFAALRLSNTRE